MKTTTLNNILVRFINYSDLYFHHEDLGMLKMGHLFYFFVAFLHETRGQKIARITRNQMLNDILKLKVLQDE